VGCAGARGEVLVIVSGHCIPMHEHWIAGLARPLLEGKAVYSYGRQVGDDHSHFSERQLFRKYFPDESQIPQKGFFANNANSAILAATWSELRFDEQLTGLEDMDMAKRIEAKGQHIAYCGDAPVYHLHDESWRQIRWRYEREAVALQRIIPEIHLTFGDFVRFFSSAVLLDWSVALQERCLHRVFLDVVKYRLMQFWGGYRGNHMHRVLSREIKDRYFYPR
jgi:rhamnosyltransferase